MGVIVWTSPFLKGGGILNTSPRGGESEKLKKGGASMVQGQVFLKVGEGWHFSHLIFLRLSFFHLEITLPLAKLCDASEENLFLSSTIIL